MNLRADRKRRRVDWKLGHSATGYRWPSVVAKTRDRRRLFDRGVVTAWHRRSGGVASARLSPANAGVVAANFETAPLAQADVFAGQKRDAHRVDRPAGWG